MHASTYITNMPPSERETYLYVAAVTAGFSFSRHKPLPRLPGRSAFFGALAQHFTLRTFMHMHIGLMNARTLARTVRNHGRLRGGAYSNLQWGDPCGSNDNEDGTKRLREHHGVDRRIGRRIKARAQLISSPCDGAGKLSTTGIS